MNRNVIETVLGAVVLLSAAVFIGFAYNSADLGKKEGYTVRAEFDRIDGLKPGSDVRLNGVLVGSILNVDLNKRNYRATVSLSMNPNVKLPRDTMATIASESLLGGKYLSIDLGVEDDTIATDGSGKITRTTPPMRLDDLIGQLIFNKDKGGDKGGGKGTDGVAPPAPAPAPAAQPSGT